MKVTNLITKKVLRDIDDINRKCHAMHLPTPPVQFFEMEVRDFDGTVVEVLKSKSNSWVRNAYNLLAQNFLPCDSYQGSSTFGAGSQAVKDTGGTTRRANAVTISLADYSTGNIYNASATNALGIVIGTSDMAESFESYGLGAVVAPGSGTGQMIYTSGVNPGASYNAGAKKWTSAMTRTFTNSSGAAITIKEIGLIEKLWIGSSVSGNVLISRDVLATPVTVNNGQTLTITYTSEITYPA